MDRLASSRVSSYQFESRIGSHHSLRSRNNTVDYSDPSDTSHDCIDNLNKDRSRLEEQSLSLCVRFVVRSFYLFVRSDNLYIEQDNGNRPNLLGFVVEYNNHH